MSTSSSYSSAVRAWARTSCSWLSNVMSRRSGRGCLHGRAGRPPLAGRSAPRCWPSAPDGAPARAARAGPTCHPRRVKLKLDLHDIYNRGTDIDRALRAVIDEAVRVKAKTVEIIPGKGSGALKKHVLRFLDQ